VSRWRPPKCGSGKTAFQSQGKALRALEKIRQDNAQAAAPLPFEPQRAYRCECGAWHLTRRAAS
jgi:hypothetical protein